MNRRTLLGFLLLMGGMSIASVHGETTELLATGPVQGRGILYLSANVIPYLEVSYRQAANQSATSLPNGALANNTTSPKNGSAATANGGFSNGVRVLYTDSAIVPYESWKTTPCGQIRFLTVQSSPLVYYFGDPNGWSLFISFPSDYKGACSFASAFVSRFQYFLGVTRNSAISSFPAVLQLP